MVVRRSERANHAPDPAQDGDLLDEDRLHLAVFRPQFDVAIVPEKPLDRGLILDEGDHERLSHFVDKSKLTEAMVRGTPVVALCGKVWIPSRDPKKFPVCPTCKAIFEDDSAGWVPEDE